MPNVIHLFTFILTIACSDKSSSDDSGNNNDQEDTNAVTNDTLGIDTGTPVESGPIIWTGPSITFTKVGNADPTDPANQDAITDSVILTRGQQGGLFNVVTETSTNDNSPEGTEWAKGTTDDIEDLEFQTLKTAANNQLKNVPGESFVLHLIEEDIYIDLTFISWESGGSGGGFSYERSTE